MMLGCRPAVPLYIAPHNRHGFGGTGEAKQGAMVMELGLAEGKECYAIIKAIDVMVAVD